MNRLIICAIVWFMATHSANLNAQFRGGGGPRGGGPAASGRAPAPSAAPRATPGPMVGLRATARPPIAGPHARGPFAGPPVHRPFVGSRVRGSFIGPTVVVPSYGYYDPFLYSAPVYSPPQEPVVQTYSSDSDQVRELSYQVERLSEEIRQLRDERQALYTQPVPEPPVVNQQPAIPTVLIFRNGRRVESQGYAIVGQTMWLLTDQTSERVALSDLDLDATQKANAERGLRFLLPR